MAGEVRILKFGETPPEGWEPGAQESRERFARELRDHPGEWAVIAVYDKGKKDAAGVYAGLVRRGQTFWKPSDEGAFEATVAPENIETLEDTEWNLWVRFVPAEQDTPRRGRGR